jgi:hypothetical protein
MSIAGSSDYADNFLASVRLGRWSTPERPLDAALLDDAEVGPILREWLAAMAVEFPDAGRPGDHLWEPFNGSPVPVVNQPAVEATKPALAVVPTPAAYEDPILAAPAAAPVVESPFGPDETETEAEVEEPVKERRTLKGTPWEDRFIEVHSDVFRNYFPPQALAVVILRANITKRTDNDGTVTCDLYINPKREAARLGVSVKTLKAYLSPKGALVNEVWLRKDDNGRLDYRRWNDRGEEYWVADVRAIEMVDNPDKPSEKMLKPNEPLKGETPEQTKRRPNPNHFIGVPTNWVYQHPEAAEGEDADWWVRTDISAEAIWGGAVCKAEAKARRGFTKGRDYIATDWNKSNGAVHQYLAAAEDAGLVLVKGPRGGQVAPFREPQQTPAPVEARTTKTRVRNGEKDKA